MFVALKLNMNKSYDRMEWIFVQDITVKLGFAEGLVRKMWICISFVSFTAILNGDPCADVVPKRGLRQECAFSPYALILCTKGLSSMLRMAESSGTLQE